MMKLEQVAEMAVARIRRLGDSHQLDLSNLSRPPMETSPIELLSGSNYDIGAFLARRKRDLTLITPSVNTTVEEVPVSNTASSFSSSACAISGANSLPLVPSYFIDPTLVASSGIGDALEGDIDEVEVPVMNEPKTNPSGGWGLYSYPT